MKKDHILKNPSCQFNFKLIKKVDPTSAVPIEYTFHYDGDALFLERCINVAKQKELKIRLEYFKNIFNLFQPKNVRHYFVVIDYYQPQKMQISSMDFYRFLKGESICFATPDKALKFEKLAVNVIEDWLNEELSKFNEIKDFSGN